MSVADSSEKQTADLTRQFDLIAKDNLRINDALKLELDRIENLIERVEQFLVRMRFLVETYYCYGGSGNARHFVGVRRMNGKWRIAFARSINDEPFDLVNPLKEANISERIKGAAAVVPLIEAVLARKKDALSAAIKAESELRKTAKVLDQFLVDLPEEEQQQEGA